MCRKGDESVKHLMSNCETLVNSLYKKRHDNALKCFIWPLLKEMGLITKCPRWFSNDEVKPRYKKDGIEFLWDSPEYSGRDNECDHPFRPDGKLTINKADDKRIFLIEMTVPWIQNRQEKLEYKCEKYINIINSIKLENPEFHVDQITIVVDVFGGYGRDLAINMKKVLNDKETTASIIKNMIKSIISIAANLSRTFKIRCK